MKKINIIAFLIIVQLTLNIGNTSAQWVQVSSGLPPYSSCYAYAVNGSNIFAVFANSAGVYITTDSVNNWTETVVKNK